MSEKLRPQLPIRVGTLVIARRDCGPVCRAGERGVCYEVYVLGGRPGYSFIFQQGGYDGFSPEDVARSIEVTDQVCPTLRDYHFSGVLQLGRDFRNGVFAQAFTMPLPQEVVPADPAAIMSEVRDKLLGFLEAHRLVCPKGTQCAEAENMMAYLCHSLGLRGPRLLKVNDLLQEYDQRCPGCRGCDVSQAAQQAARRLNAKNN
jgi:hypothetical protein